MKLIGLAILGVLAAGRLALGDVRIEQWLQVPGNEVTDALAQGELDRPADATRSWESFEAVTSQEADAVMVTGIVRAPEDGQYRFMIAADDTALLFLSVGARPENRQQIALVPAFGGRCDWTRYAAQRSEPITLKAGQRCLLQAVVKNGSGDGHVEVGWELPGGNIEGPIPASRIETPSGPIPPPGYGSVAATVTIKPDVRPATAPGPHKFPGAARVQVGDKQLEMSYLLFLPGDYDKTSDPRPLFIFLHGNGHQGMDLEGILNEGPARFLNEVPALREWMPMAMLCPQLPLGWRWDTPGAAEMTNALVREVCKQYPRFDTDRVYLSGLSMGGKGTWLLAYDAPAIYAAIVPISSVAVRPEAAARKFAGLHTWIICGEHDHLFTQGSREMYERMAPLGESKVKLTVVPNDGHGCWARFYPDRGFYEQVMQYRRSAVTARGAK